MSAPVVYMSCPTRVHELPYSCGAFPLRALCLSRPSLPLVVHRESLWQRAGATQYRNCAVQLRERSDVPLVQLNRWRDQRWDLLNWKANMSAEMPPPLSLFGCSEAELAQQFNTAAFATHQALDDAECLSIESVFEPKLPSGVYDGRLQLSKAVWTEMYGMYKVATEGECKVPPPPFWALRGRAKWQAWVAQGKLSARDAKLRFVGHALRLRGLPLVSRRDCLADALRCFGLFDACCVDEPPLPTLSPVAKPPKAAAEQEWWALPLPPPPPPRAAAEGGGSAASGDGTVAPAAPGARLEQIFGPPPHSPTVPRELRRRAPPLRPLTPCALLTRGRSGGGSDAHSRAAFVCRGRHVEPATGGEPRGVSKAHRGARVQAGGRDALQTDAEMGHGASYGGRTHRACRHARHRARPVLSKRSGSQEGGVLKMKMGTPLGDRVEAFPIGAPERERDPEGKAFLKTTGAPIP